MVEAPETGTVQFGPFEADLATGELRRDGAKVPLQDKPFQILMRLLRRPGTLVTREELRSELWPADTFVDFEHGLNTAVRKLRQALDDSADTPRFVETLPRRGYRFVGEVIGAPSVFEPPPAPSPSPVSSSPPPPVTSAHQASRWPIHAAWAAVVLLAVVLLRADRRGESTQPEIAANPRPVIVLMDSPLPGRVYDARTAAAGGTNADDITDALQELAVAIRKENTSPMWHREEQVVRQNPDLVVSHLSCLLDERVAGEGERAVFDHLFTVASSRLLGVYGYVGAANPRTRFLVYSRGAFSTGEKAALFVKDAESRFPVLRGRLHTMHVPGGLDNASFRDPETARLIRDRVKAILGLS